MKKIDELDKFIVDENEPADKKVLAEIIKPYVNSIGKNEIIDFTKNIDKLVSWKKNIGVSVL